MATTKYYVDKIELVIVRLSWLYTTRPLDGVTVDGEFIRAAI